MSDKKTSSPIPDTTLPDGGTNSAPSTPKPAANAQGDDKTATKKSAREDRLAAALRDNLRRRKAPAATSHPSGDE